ncbi:hypothetical protein STEG23_011498 [Scotinomys teguina]
MRVRVLGDPRTRSQATLRSNPQMQYEDHKTHQSTLKSSPVGISTRSSHLSLKLCKSQARDLPTCYQVLLSSMARTEGTLAHALKVFISAPVA